MTFVLLAYQFYFKVWPWQNQELGRNLTHSYAYLRTLEVTGKQNPNDFILIFPGSKKIKQ